MALILKNFIDDTGAVRPECFIRCEAFKSKVEHNGLLIKIYFYHNIDAWNAGKTPIKIARFVAPLESEFYQNNFSTSKELEANKTLLILIYDFLKTVDGTDATIVFPELCINDLRDVNLTQAISTFSQEEIDDGVIDGLASLQNGDVYYNETTNQYQEYQNGDWFIL